MDGLILLVTAWISFALGAVTVLTSLHFGVKKTEHKEEKKTVQYNNDGVNANQIFNEWIYGEK